MNFKLTGRNVEIEEADREYCLKRLGKMEKIVSQILDVEVVVSKERFTAIADITLKSKIALFNAKEKGKDVKSALNALFDLLELQAKREKEKLTTKKKKKEEPPVVQEESLREEPTQEVSDSFSTKPITLKEALGFLKESSETVYAFKNIDNGYFTVLYKKGKKQTAIIEMKG